jgi:hypothetical protein
MRLKWKRFRKYIKPVRRGDANPTTTTTVGGVPFWLFVLAMNLAVK